jgi:hypothetical protein
MVEGVASHLTLGLEGHFGVSRCKGHTVGTPKSRECDDCGVRLQRNEVSLEDTRHICTALGAQGGGLAEVGCFEAHDSQLFVLWKRHKYHFLPSLISAPKPSISLPKLTRSGSPRYLAGKTVSLWLSLIIVCILPCRTSVFSALGWRYNSIRRDGPAAASGCGIREDRHWTRSWHDIHGYVR